MATTSKSATPDSAATDPLADESPFLTPRRIRLLGIGGAVLLVAALIVWFMVTAGRRKETYAAGELERARDAAAQGNLGVAVQGYTRISTAYAGTSAAYEAQLGIAQARLVNGQNELAISSLNDFIHSNPPATYSAPAYGLLGTAYENTGKFSEAVTAYRKASDLATVDYLKASSLLDAGRAASLAHKTDDAKAIYQEIITKYSKTGALSEAQVRLAELTGGAS